MNLWGFLNGILPALMQLAQDLFRRHRGNAQAATAEIELLRNHGARLVQEEAGMRAELERLAAADTKREKPPR